MSLIMQNSGDRFVDRAALAAVPTPAWTTSWHPVPHCDVVQAVETAATSRGLRIVDERFGLARGGQKMFGVMTMANSGNPEWTRAIGIRNSHDQSFAAGVCCGVSVLVCSNLCFGGEHVLKRRHTSGIDIREMADETVAYLADGFVTLEERLDELRDTAVTSDDSARLIVMKAAESGVIASCNILPVINEYLEPRHSEFRERTQWSLMNAFTEIAHKYPPAKTSVFHRRLTRLFGLDGARAMIDG